MKSLGLMQGVEEGKGEEMRRKTILAVELALSGLLVSGLPRLAGATVFEDATWSRNKGNNDRLYTYSDDENEFRITDSYQATAIFLNNGAQVEINATTGSNTATDNDTGRTNAWWGAWVNDSSSLTMNAAQNNEITGMGIRDTAVYANNGGQIHLEADKNILKGVNSAVSVVTQEANIEVIGRSGNEISIASNTFSSTRAAVYSNEGTTTIRALNGDNVISSTHPDEIERTFSIKTGGEASIIAENGSNVLSSTHMITRTWGSSEQTTGTEVSHLLISAARDNVMTVSTSEDGEGLQADNLGVVEVESTNGSNIIRVSGTGAAGLVTFQEGSLTLTAGSGDNDIETDAFGIYNQTSSDISVITGTGTNRIVAPDLGVASTYGAQTTLQGQTIVESDTALLADGQDEDDSGNAVGDGASIDLQYDGTSTIEGDVAAYNKGTITIAPRDDAQQDDQRVDLTGTYLASYQDDTEDPEEFVGGTINLTLTDGSTFTGTATNASRSVALEDRGTDRMGTINLEMYGSSLWTMTDSSSISTLSGNGGTVHFANGGDHLEITEGVSGSHTYDMDLSYADKTHSDMLYARTGTSDHQTLNVKNLEQLNSEMSAGDAVRYATVQSDAGGGFLGNDYVIVNGLYNDTLTTEYRTVSSDPNRTDTYDADLDAAYGLDDATNIYLVKEEALNDGAVTPSRNRDMIWRSMTTLDTFTKRDGEARYFTDEGKRGAWVRLGYSNLGVDGVGELDGNTYELGWTTVSRQNDERKHRFSASVAYGKPKGHFEGYGGDLTVRDFSVNLYDTHEYYPSAEELANKPEWKKESHAYWDNYLKYHHVKTEYDAYDHVVGTKYSGDYDQDVWNLSTEYGHKLMMNEDWFWVPQAQLQLSYLGSYDYVDSQGLHVDGDHDWSLIGRLGFDLVRDIHDSRDSKIYFKASLLHEFLDGNDVTVRYDGDRYVNEGDQSGTWGVVGLGFSSKIGDKQYFYLDAERYFGNDFERTYDIRAGVNWKF